MKSSSRAAGKVIEDSDRKEISLRPVVPSPLRAAGVFVVVDLASRINQADQQFPGLCPAARHMARHAAKLILEEIEGKRPTSDGALPQFRDFDKGSIATIAVEPASSPDLPRSRKPQHEASRKPPLAARETADYTPIQAVPRPSRANLAQLVEQLICNQPVVGSSPTVGFPSNSTSYEANPLRIRGLGGYSDAIYFLLVARVSSSFPPSTRCFWHQGWHHENE